MKPGIAVMREGTSPHWRADALGARAIRLVIPHWWDATAYLQEVRAKGWDVLAILDRDGFADWNDWRRSAERDFQRVDDLYVKTGLITALALGNEFDDGWHPGMHDDPSVQPRGGVSSWTMPFAEQAEMVSRAWDHFRDVGTGRSRIPLVLGGSSSGQPTALEGFDFTKLSAVQLHPYGKRPSEDWPHANWGFGFIGWWLDPVRQLLEARGVVGTCRIMIGELGLSSYDADEGTQAEWFRRMLTYLIARGDVDAVFAFCDSDHNVDGYGAFKVDERPKLWVQPVAEIFTRLPSAPLLNFTEPVPALWPDEPEPEPEEPAEPEQPSGWWDKHFTAEEIAVALAEVRTKLGRPTHMSEVVDEIRANWPEFGPFLATYGVQDNVNVKMALLSTIWVECLWRVAPVDEVGTYDYFERNYGYQTAVGRVLGNLYPGDGARYKARGYGITGRANYRHMASVFNAPLLEQPEELDDPTLAAGTMVVYAAERGMLEQARAGNWEQVRRTYNGGLNGYDWFILGVNTLRAYADEDHSGPPPPDVATRLRSVLELGATRIGDPYVVDGERPGGFDCSGFTTWGYREALGIHIISYTDAQYDETDAISKAQSLPGDLVLYEYYDASQPGVRFPHVALVTEREDIVLDARGGVGVGWHPHVQGAVRHYRRVRGLGAVEDPEEAMWKEKAEGLINAVAYLGDDVADEIEAERSKLDDYGNPPKPPKPANKMLKADWEAHARALEAWAMKVRDNTDARYKGIGTAGEKLRKTREQFVGPRP